MKQKILSMCVSLLLIAVNSYAEVNYAPYADILKKYVNQEGLVDYKGLLNNEADKAQFAAFIDYIERIDISGLSDVQRKTFWINAYNAITLNVILDKYPVRSIRHINFGLVWEVPRKVAGTKHSLGHIEHDILRPLGDPRIHFAINCASIGCPKLPNKPFYPKILNEQLDQETRRFINDAQKIRVDKEKGILYRSAIMDWFEDDFLATAPSIKDYVMQYINEADKQYLKTHDVKVKTLKYDWGLNEQ